jgi:hypothetical protein
MMESLFEECKWCNGSGDDGGGYNACPDCESTGLKGGRYALEKLDEEIERRYRELLIQGVLGGCENERI